MRALCSRLRPSLGWRRRAGRRWTSSAAPPTRQWPGSLVTLAIETSCDDTCVAILEKEQGVGKTGQPARARLLFEERITADNRAFGGIHPAKAAETHTTALAPLVQRSLQRLPVQQQQRLRPGFISVTRGPGMPTSLATGLAMAKGLAAAWDVPLVGVHHMQAHALTPRLVAALAAAAQTTADDQREAAETTTAFPYLSLLVSGGHTLLVLSRSLADHRVLAAAANIAVGDLLDKSARAVLPPGYIAAAEAQAGRSLPYGALLEGFASSLGDSSYVYPSTRRLEMAPFVGGDGWRVEAPLGTGPLRRTMRFDFSGLNGQVVRVAEAMAERAGAADDRPRLARAVMQLAFEHLASRLLMALDQLDNSALPTCLVVAGGVASNRFLRRVLRSALDVRGYRHLPLVAPPPALCTDNAAMIAWAGMEMFEAGWQTDLAVRPIRRWPMDAAENGGILGAEGWRRRT